MRPVITYVSEEVRFGRVATRVDNPEALAQAYGFGTDTRLLMKRLAEALDVEYLETVLWGFHTTAAIERALGRKHLFV